VLSAWIAPAWAQQLATPVGPPILTISGKISRTSDGKAAAFDLAGLEAVGRTTLATSTKWTEGVVPFEGVPMATLLDAVGASGTEIVAIALNDYQVTIPIDDFRKYGVILAYRRNGSPMPVRDRGPLWIIYPFDQVPALKADIYYSRCAWQLKSIEVR
jgi:hypothetical protein